MSTIFIEAPAAACLKDAQHVLDTPCGEQFYRRTAREVIGLRTHSHEGHLDDALLLWGAFVGMTMKSDGYVENALGWESKPADVSHRVFQLPGWLNLPHREDFREITPQQGAEIRWTFWAADAAQKIARAAPKAPLVYAADMDSPGWTEPGRAIRQRVARAVYNMAYLTSGRWATMDEGIAEAQGIVKQALRDLAAMASSAPSAT